MATNAVGVAELLEHERERLAVVACVEHARAGCRHISAKRLLKLVMRPSPSTTRMPSAVDSSVAASTEFAARRSDSTATRSLMSWPVTTSPSTVGSSSRFVNVSANGTVVAVGVREAARRR